MVRRQDRVRRTKLAAILGSALVLIGCQALRQATGLTKQSPDEFTILTKSPLVIPPDFNLRPPQPGIAARYEVDPAEQAQRALFPQSAVTRAAALGDSYSDGEKLLLSETNALAVDPRIRRIITADAGQEDQGPEFAQKVLYGGAASQARVANIEDAANTATANSLAAPAKTAEVLAPVVTSQTALSALPLAVNAAAYDRIAAATPTVHPPETLLLRPSYDR
jgi:hypothetical protein